MCFVLLLLYRITNSKSELALYVPTYNCCNVSICYRKFLLDVYIVKGVCYAHNSLILYVVLLDLYDSFIYRAYRQ